MRSTSRWAWVLGAALGLASSAWAGGGAGITVESVYYPRYGQHPGDYEAPGPLLCVGGMGLGVSDSGFRIGGEAAFCRGRDGVSLNRGGAQLGFRTRGRGLYWTLYTGIGVGALRDTTQLSGTYTAAFAYLRPTTAIGITSRIGALEVGLQAMTPINLVQWVKAGESRGFLHPTVGAQLTMLFGNFRGPRRDSARRDVPAPVVTPAASAPLAIPGGAPPPIEGPPQGYVAPPPPAPPGMVSPAPPPPPAGTTTTTTIITTTTAPVVPASSVPLAVPVWGDPTQPVVEETEAPESAPAPREGGGQK
jgi:hypothetical protein